MKKNYIPKHADETLHLYNLLGEQFKGLLLFALCIGLMVGSNTVKAQGANTPFKTLEAEDGTLGGGAKIRGMAILPSGSTVEVESSGRQLVELDATGEWVSWENTTGITSNTIVARVSIPDAPEGGGIKATLNLYVDGLFRQALDITSEQSWVYGIPGKSGQWNDPSVGKTQVFYSEASVFIVGEPIAPGSTVMLKKDADNTAPYYHIDLIDLENVPAPKNQPVNSLSVTDYGAIADDEIDDTEAFKACVSACESQDKEMWIPAGLFHTSDRIKAREITISGAGMWHTTIYRTVPLPNTDNQRCDFYLIDCTIRDLKIDGNANGKGRQNGVDYGIQQSGTIGWLIERVWIQHADAGIWATGVNGLVKDSRVNNCWGDGINLNNGIGPEKLGRNLTAKNNYVRCTGDDGFAINNSIQEGGPMDNIKLLNNTSIAVWKANGMRIAGGKNIVVKGNLICDPAEQNGLVVGVFHEGAALQSALVEGNVIIRGGGYAPVGNSGKGAGMVIGHSNTPVKATVRGNIIIDAHRYGILVGTDSVTVTLEGNTVDNPAKDGFYIQPLTKGTAIITNNTVTNLNIEQTAYRNDETYFFETTLEGNSWQTPVTGLATKLGQGHITNIYPNPVSGRSFFIAPSDALTYQSITVNVTDLFGRSILSKMFITKGTGPIEVVLPASIATGVYHLSVNDRYISKLVVQ